MTRWPAGLVLALSLTGATLAQTVPATTGAAPPAIDTSSPEAVRAAVARLSDAEVRRILLERLDAVAARGQESPSLGEELTELGDSAATGFMRATARALEGLAHIPDGIGEAFDRFHDRRGWTGTLHLIAIGALAFAAGFAVEALGRRLLARREARIATARPDSPGQTLALVAERLAMELGLLALFMLTAWAVIAGLHPAEPMSYLVLWFFLKEPVLYARATAAVSRFLLAPGLPQLRLLHVDDAPARRLHWHLTFAAFLIGLLMGYVTDFLGGHGVDLGRLRAGYWLSLAASLWLCTILLRERAALSIIMQGGRSAIGAADAWVARAYPWMAAATVMLAWVLSQVMVGLERWDLLDGRILLSMVLLIGAPPLDGSIRWAVTQFGPRPDGSGALAEDARAAAARAYLRILRVVGTVLLVLLLTELWQVSLAELTRSRFDEQVATRLVAVLGVLATGYVLWELAGLWFNRRLARETAAAAPEGDADPGGEGGGAGGSRLSTVLPLMSSVVRSAILVFTLLMAIGNLGIDTTPLLAGAGVVGLAIGFGAQKLVSDIVSGLFFLIDDAFRIGEYVEIEGTYGTVEKISLRSLRLRHHEGPVHTLPFGEIRKLTNYSRDWVIMKIKFTMPFETDLKLVKRIFKKIGREMDEAPQFEGDFLRPFKLQGVYEVDDVGIVIRGKFMCRPGRQWVLRKEIYARVQEEFEAAGLQFARREVRVRIDGGSGAELGPERIEAIGAAAAEAVQAAEPSPTGTPGN